jgi:membrane associated rhomboid family serine protease
MAVVVLVTHIWIVAAEQHHSFVQNYGCSAEAMVNGELFRAVTALFLHVDLLHLAGNCVGIALFGTAVVRQVGFGVGWFLILASGIAGNLTNAWVHRTDHLSVGSSTAIFGGVGIIMILQLFRARRGACGRRGFLVPIGGGLALLAMLGSGGERTDLLAHFFGFGAGVILTIPVALLLRRRLASRYQWSLVGVACAVIAAGWLQVLRI